MIISKAPLRISFFGGGSDLASFYTRCSGSVISATINKFIYVAVNKTPHIDQLSIAYSIKEVVTHPSELQHKRIRESLIDLGITNNIEIASFASMVGGIGLGSSSSFSVALVKALFASQEKKISKLQAAEYACRLEIDLLGEPIGKQDQYAAALGGFNILHFNPDHSIDIHPVPINYKIRRGLEASLLLFFTGITRDASSVLTEQKTNTDQNFEVLKTMVDMVPKFEKYLLDANFKKLGEMLHQGWLLKKTLSSTISNPAIDQLYTEGINAGAWGGKILGAGGGGCILFIAPPENKKAIAESLTALAKKINLSDCKEIPFKFIQSGVELLCNDAESSIDCL